MLRRTSEGPRDPNATEYEEIRPARKAPHRDIKSSASRNRMDRGSTNSNECLTSLCWVDVFEEEFFGGRLTRLRAGDHKDMKKPGSIIIGPDATARSISRKTNKVRHLQSRTVCPSISLRGNPFPLRVEAVSALRA